jgi:hypothetical protein
MFGSVVSLSMAMTSNTVSQKEAKSVAKKFIARISATEDFKDWKNAEIGKIVTAYDVDESRTAYIFELVKDGRYAGYIVVSAKRTNYPILEFSKGKSPLARMEELGIKAERVYYLSALVYFFEEKGKYYDLNKKGVDFNRIKEGVRAAMRDEKVREHLIKRAIEAENQWKVYEVYLDFATPTVLASSNYIHGVPAFLWDDGCTPTAAAMILEYWGEHDYPNLNYPDWWYWEDTDYGDGNGYDNPSNEHTDLTEKLHVAMGTWDWNGYTPPAAVSPGINKVLNDHGYGNWAGDVLYYDWDWNVNEINSGYPYILTMWLFNLYGWPHSVTVVGYKVVGSSKYITVHDTWTTADVDIAFGDWLGTSAHRVHPP